MEAQIKWSIVVYKTNVPSIELSSPVTNCHLLGQMTEINCLCSEV